MAQFNGVRSRAEQAGSGARGLCPWTSLPVKACVGAIRQYWAYDGGAPQLERGYEPETDWHLSWKELVTDSACEVVFGANKEHRADILGADNTVIEIQHSPIDIRDVRERVEFYRSHTGRRVVWIVDIRDFWLTRFNLVRQKDGGFKVNWKPIRKWLWELAATTETMLYLEFKHKNDKLLHVWVYKGDMYARYVSKSNIFMQYLHDVSRSEYRGFSAEALKLMTHPYR
ncbi:hypothetical protein [Xanthomonas translucens]|uniref:competence protein CoiA family protein n=1 Tax=Xanthomonas campestris pv. translucens TaxID=343 RepID=UPI0019D594D7|nr:hypothetical protein [Xanthomonas translucens]QSQ37829.1 hypothetical protein ISN32_19235 [Xanthomonas translucens pv. translucens]